MEVYGDIDVDIQLLVEQIRVTYFWCEDVYPKQEEIDGRKYCFSSFISRVPCQCKITEEFFSSPFLTLIPKVPYPLVQGNFRPNCFYKMVSTIMVVRLVSLWTHLSL